MAFLELCICVTERIKKYIFLLISIQEAIQKRKFQPDLNSANTQRIPATRLISQHFESDLVKVGGRRSAITGTDDPCMFAFATR